MCFVQHREESVGHGVHQLVDALKPSQRSCLAKHVIDGFACIGCYDSIGWWDLDFIRDPVSALPKVINVLCNIISRCWLVGPHLFQNVINIPGQEGLCHGKYRPCSLLSVP